MKKVIAVLAILVVLVGAVFAADNNTTEAKKADGKSQIILNATVKELIPQFKLSIAANQPIDESAVGATVAEGTISGETVSPAATAKAEATLTENAVKDLIGNNATETPTDVTIAFGINQVGKANLRGGYDITVTATDLDLVKFANGTDRTGDLVAATQRFAVATTGDNTKTPKVTASTTVVDGRTLQAAGNKLTVTYDGAAQVSGAEIGTFAVKWTANANAVAGDYKATVEMSVTSK